MTTARFFLGVSLFVVLIADICCVPVKKGQNPSPPQSGSGLNAANFPSNLGVHHAYYPGGLAAPIIAPSRDASPPDASYSQPAVQSEAAGSAGSSSRPGQPGYSVSSTQSGGPPPPEVDWLVKPPSLSSGSQGASAATGDLGSSRPGETSVILPPLPELSYQAGELSHFERNAENGASQSEREEMGYPTGHPFDVPLGPGYPSYPFPPVDLGGFFGHPYPYYDYRFLTGQYPPGTVSHFSQNYEQGRDFWQDNHYLKEHALPSPPPGQQVATFPGPQGFRDSRPPVNLPGYRPGGAGQPSSAHRVYA
ncbi:calcium-binding protein P-like [Amphiprion ocellaris]|uniref:calcium-binding protein P-like n=1 Tax=Amphiprion ocellaris TaxID=80972 RepID=UPI000C318B2C|nr:calcium-binding protein P-like [Amphiprion ocellaris]